MATFSETIWHRIFRAVLGEFFLLQPCIHGLGFMLQVFRFCGAADCSPGFMVSVFDWACCVVSSTVTYGLGFVACKTGAQKTKTGFFHLGEMKL